VQCSVLGPINILEKQICRWRPSQRRKAYILGYTIPSTDYRCVAPV